METRKYERIDFKVWEDVEFVKIIRPDGDVDTVNPFKHLPIKISYEEEGMENIESIGEEEFYCRYTPDFIGEATVEFYGTKVNSTPLIVQQSENHGYVEVGKKDTKYFSYSDGTPFFSVGINTAFPSVHISTDGREFGRSKVFKYIGLKLYERWF